MSDESGLPSPASLSVGDTGPEVVVEDLQRQDFVRYAGASGDFNPVHYDEPHAKNSGYPSVFGQGMLTAGFAARAATDWFGVASIDQFSVRFRAKVWPGDTLVAVCEVADITAGEDGHCVDGDLRVENQDGDVVVTGSVTATLSE